MQKRHLFLLCEQEQGFPGRCKLRVALIHLGSAPNTYLQALMTSLPSADISKASWMKNIHWQTSPPFRLKWLTKVAVPFSRIGYLKNSLNENLSVLIAKDGQEVEEECGRLLMREMELYAMFGSNKTTYFPGIRHHKLHELKARREIDSSSGFNPASWWNNKKKPHHNNNNNNNNNPATTTPTRTPNFGAGALASQQPLPNSPFPDSVQLPDITDRSSSMPRRENSQHSRKSKDSDEMDMDDSEGEDGHASDDEEINADGTKSKKKKSQRFYCTDYPPCNLSFTRSEHLARHIRYATLNLLTAHK